VGGPDHEKKLERTRRWRERHRDELNAHRREQWTGRLPVSSAPLVAIPYFEVDELTQRAAEFARWTVTPTTGQFDSGDRDIVQDVVLAMLEGRDPKRALTDAVHNRYFELYVKRHLEPDYHSAGPLIL
jgi:hypothetical protein